MSIQAIKPIAAVYQQAQILYNLVHFRRYVEKVQVGRRNDTNDTFKNTRRRFSLSSTGNYSSINGNLQ